MGDVLPNGLVTRPRSLIESSDSLRWLKAEERIKSLSPTFNPIRHEKNAGMLLLIMYKNLLRSPSPARWPVFTFGSFPLKTYLPDGDINLTVISKSANFRESLPSEVRDMLETEENNENVRFHVKEVQYIQYLLI
ncbi:hypothetical protein L1887_28213 [Cichorium endivia]|nr:hypothetical protein L1887_28213 [Cichorium endivia]